MFELGIQKNWIDALYARSSVRQYTGAPDKEQLDRLGETCRKLSWQGVKIRMFKGPGLKNQIKGTDVYAVIVAKRGTPMEVEGYMGEALVLEATSMGLGTCWLGAGFYPDIINRNVDLQTDEAVHCVISIGKANLPAFAPSAINQQPWKIVADKTSVSILETTVLYKKYAPLDRGICMLHAAVGAAKAGRTGLWKKVDGGYAMKA